MACRTFNLLDLVAGFEESARRGDWKTARESVAILGQQSLPASQEELGEYLRCMKEALIVAKVSRAQAAATLERINTVRARLNAAAGFNNMRVDFAPPRQEFGEAADS